MIFLLRIFLVLRRRSAYLRDFHMRTDDHLTSVGLLCTLSSRNEVTNPVGLEYRMLGLTCEFTGTCVRSNGELVLAGEPAKDRSAADLVVGEIDHAWGMGLGLGRRELPEHLVWPCGVEVVL
jgi:hypothetical protein